MRKFSIYFKYNLIQAVITGLGTFIMMLVAGMPYKISITLLITVSQLIPIVGAIVGTGVSALLIAAVSPGKAIIFIVLSIVVQQFVEKVINPHLMGKELEMPGVLTFLAIVIGGKHFGLIGLVCSVPVVSIFYDIYNLKIHPKLYEGTDNNANEEKAEQQADKE
jgi:predicted PurR-regulated permease PerM